jgi:hypothetical protein
VVPPHDRQLSARAHSTRRAWPCGGQRTGWPCWKTAVIAVIVIMLLAVMVVLHLTASFGAGTHG